MRRLVLVLVVAAGSLVAAPVGLADTPLFSTTDGGAGAVHGNMTYAVYHFAGVTTIVATGGPQQRQLPLKGYWYFPNTAGGAEGLSHDGKTLLLVDVVDKTQFRQTTFLVIDPIRMKILRSLQPYLSSCTAASSCGSSRTAFLLTDGLSPDASELYAVAYTDVGSGLASPCLREYAFDIPAGQSVPIRRDDPQDSPQGTAVGRSWSANGRWAYTLYQEPSGAWFIQALDTVGSAVHCISLPKNRGVNPVLSLGNDDRTIAVRSSGGPSFDIAVSGWRISRHPFVAAFPWGWLMAGIGGLALVGAAGGLVLWRRRGEKLA